MLSLLADTCDQEHCVKHAMLLTHEAERRICICVSKLIIIGPDNGYSSGKYAVSSRSPTSLQTGPSPKPPSHHLPPNGASVATVGRCRRTSR